MMTTKKRMRNLPALAVIATAGALLTACSPPGGRDLSQGAREISAGEYGAAIAPLMEATHALSSAPPAVQSKALNLLGLAYQNAGQLDAASQTYLQALRLNKNHETVDFNLGCVRMEQSNFPGAIDYFTTCVALNPRGVDGFVKLGEAQYHLALEKTGVDKAKQLENARHEFEMADKLRPTAEAANGLGMVELQRRNGGAEAVRAAAADFQMAVERDATYGPALLNLAILCQQHLNQLPKALQLYRQYVALQPLPPHAKEVAKLVVQLDLETRVTIGHDSGEQPAPSSRVIITPTNSTPKAAPAEHPSTKVTKPVPGPAPTSEVRVVAVPAQSPQPPPTPPPNAAAPPLASAVPAQSPAPTVTVIVTPTNDIPAPQIAAPQAVTPQPTVPQDGVPQSVVPPPSKPQREPLVERLNPLHWFSSKSKGPEAAPVPKGTRYKYPPRTTPIPGNRREAVRLAEQGAEARKAGSLDVALRKFSESANADATFFDAELALGETAIDTGDYDSAMKALYRALALDEDSAEARYAFGWALQRRGYYIDAARELERLLEAHPDDARGHLLLGNLDAEKLGLLKQARQHYGRVLELDPGNSQVPAIRAWILKTP